MEDIGCESTYAFGLLNNITVLTSIYITCVSINMNFQLAIMYDRHQFYWIGADETKTGKPKWFGDIPRAMHK